MKSNKIRIIQLVSFLQSCLLFSLPTMAEDHGFQLVESHPTAETSNSAEVSLTFDQADTQEAFRLEFYNSNPDAPVLIINLNEFEQFHNRQPDHSGIKRPSSIDVSIRKEMTFYPAVLSGSKSNQPLRFEFINPPNYYTEQADYAPNEQPIVSYKIGVAWDKESLVLTFQQQSELPKEINITDWAQKRGIKLARTPTISKINVLAKTKHGKVSIQSEYQLSQSLGLSFPIFDQVFGAAKNSLENPEIFWLPTSRSFEKVIIDTCEKIAREKSMLIYMLTPPVEDTADAQRIAELITWHKTTHEQDMIYNEVMKLSLHRFYSSDRLIRIDERSNEVIWPSIKRLMDRTITLRPKNSHLNKYWVISSHMSWEKQSNNQICEYSNGHKECKIFSSIPMKLENRLAFITRDQAGTVKAWLGPSDHEQINLSESFPDIYLVKEFEFSKDFQEKQARY